MSDQGRWTQVLYNLDMYLVVARMLGHTQRWATKPKIIWLWAGKSPTIHSPWSFNQSISFLEFLISCCFFFFLWTSVDRDGDVKRDSLQLREPAEAVGAGLWSSPSSPALACHPWTQYRSEIQVGFFSFHLDFFSPFPASPTCSLYF